jgi:hypothetical protein
VGVEKDPEQADYWFGLAAEKIGPDVLGAIKNLFDLPDNRNGSKVVAFPGSPTIQGGDFWKSQLENIKSLMYENIGAQHSASLFAEVLGATIFDLSTKELVETGENRQIEFKETFAINTHTAKKDDELKFATLREICGFLNTNDGVLLIGVRDPKNRKGDDGAIAGIQQDGFSGDEDNYILQITNSVKSAMGLIAASLVDPKIIKIEGHNICRIECRKSSSMVYCSFSKKGQKAFGRYGSSTTEILPSELAGWAVNYKLSI